MVFTISSKAKFFMWLQNEGLDCDSEKFYAKLSEYNKKRDAAKKRLNERTK